MRICIVTNRTENVRWFREDLVALLAKRGHDVLVLGDEESAKWDCYFANLGARYLAYPIRRSGLNPIEEVSALNYLTHVFQHEKPDKVFTYQAKANVYGCLAASRAGVPEIYASVEGLGTLADEIGLKRKVVNLILRMLYKPALSAAIKVFFINPDDVAFFLSHKLVDKDKVVMTNGNLGKFAFTPIPEGKPLFLFMGRLVKAKGIREFVNAARMMIADGVDAEFHILGDFDTSLDAISEQELCSWVDEGCVVYDGAVDDVRPFLQKCTALVSPSHREGVPKSAMEAMAVGRPIVASDITGFRIVVENGKTGILVSLGSTELLASGMRELVSQPGMAKVMGEAARRKAEKEFDVGYVNETICSTMGV